MMRLRTEEEIDTWYEEQKQRIMEEYVSEISKGKNHDNARESHTDKLNSLMNKYNILLEKNKKRQEKAEKFKKIICSIKDKIRFKKTK